MTHNFSITATGILIVIVAGLQFTAGCSDGSDGNAADVRPLDTVSDSVQPPDSVTDAALQGDEIGDTPNPEGEITDGGNDISGIDAPAGDAVDSTAGDSSQPDPVVCPCQEDEVDACLPETSAYRSLWCAKCALCIDSVHCVGCTGTVDCNTYQVVLLTSLYARSPCCPDCDELPADSVCGQDGSTYPNPCSAGCAATTIAHEGACD